MFLDNCQILSQFNLVTLMYADSIIFNLMNRVVFTSVEIHWIVININISLVEQFIMHRKPFP